MSNDKYLGYKKIDKITAAASAVATDILPVLQSGDTGMKTITLAQLQTMIDASVDAAYTQMLITDTDGTVEGTVWYDASEDKLKFKTGAGVETVTSA